MVKQVFLRSLSVLVLSSAVAMLGVLVDGIIIGQFLPGTALAAYGIAIPATVLVVGVANVISSGASSFCGRCLGRGDPEGADRYFSAAFYDGGILGFVLAAALLAIMGPVCAFLGAPTASGELHNATREFLIGYLPAVPAIIVVQLLSALTYLENARRLAFISAAVGTAVNIGGDLLNVYVFHGGLGGMALATSVSYWAMLGILLPHFFGRDHLLNLRRSSVAWAEFRDLWLIGLPSADIQVCSMLRSIVLNHLLLALAAEAAVAAFSIRMSMYNLYGSFVLGFGMATLILVSFYSGEEHTSAMEEVLRVACKYGLVTMAVLCLIVSALAPALVALYTADPVTADMAVMSVRLFALSLPLFVLNSIMAKYYQAMHQSTLSHIITILQNLVYICLLAFAMGQVLSVNGVWLSFLVTEFLVFLTILLVAWGRQGHWPHSLADLMLLPPGFGVAPEDQLMLQCRTRADASEAAARVADFLRGHGATKQVELRLSLCIEEILLNFVGHGVVDAAKESAAVRVMAKPGEWVVCLRDNARPFDPKRWLELHGTTRAKDDAGELGLRLVFQAADDITYTRVLDMNQIKISMPRET